MVLLARMPAAELVAVSEQEDVATMMESHSFASFPTFLLFVISLEHPLLFYPIRLQAAMSSSPSSPSSRFWQRIPFLPRNRPPLASTAIEPPSSDTLPPQATTSSVESNTALEPFTYGLKIVAESADPIIEQVFHPSVPLILKMLHWSGNETLANWPLGQHRRRTRPRWPP